MDSRRMEGFAADAAKGWALRIFVSAYLGRPETQGRPEPARPAQSVKERSGHSHGALPDRMTEPMSDESGLAALRLLW